METGRWRNDTWMEKELERLDALYRKFGRAGLKECGDAHLLLWHKQLALRDAKGNMDAEEKRRLELEIKDLAGLAKERKQEMQPRKRVERQQGRGHEM